MIFNTRQSEGSEDQRFQLLFNDLCLEPGTDKVVITRECSKGWWSWGEEGMMVWRTRVEEVGQCFTSIKPNEVAVVKPCEELNEAQYVEFGNYEEHYLQPLCLECWETRQARLRARELVEYRKVVTDTLKEISDNEVASLGVPSQGQRRAAVFYVDSKQAVQYLVWWIYAWKFIGLNKEEEAFDIVVMVSPDTVDELPGDCKEYTEDMNTQAPGIGKCIFKQFIGNE